MKSGIKIAISEYLMNFLIGGLIGNFVWVQDLRCLHSEQPFSECSEKRKRWRSGLKAGRRPAGNGGAETKARKEIYAMQ